VADFTAPIYPLCVGRHSNIRHIPSTRVSSLLVEGSKSPSRIGSGGLGGGICAVDFVDRAVSGQDLTKT